MCESFPAGETLSICEGKIAMLLRLYIHDLAIIDDLTLEFSSGFTALTGETGAGKSIIIGALNLLLGERASNDDVRTGAKAALVEALFDVTGRSSIEALLKELNLAEDMESGELILRREVSAQGRSRCMVNGRLVPLAQMRRLGDLLVDLHGQHQHQSLLRIETHRVLLDAYGGVPLRKALDTYSEAYARYGRLSAQLRALDRDERDIERQKGLLEYQLNEIRDVAPEAGEDEALEEELQRLRHSDALKRDAFYVVDVLLEGEAQETTVLGLLGLCEESMQGATRLDGSLEEYATRLVDARAELDDLALSLRSYAAGLEHDPVRLSDAEDRLHALSQLKRKYGATLGEVLVAAERFAEELDALVHSDEARERLEAEVAGVALDLAQAAEMLSAKRRTVGEKFSKDLRAELKQLEMPDVRFEVRLDRDKNGELASEEEDAPVAEGSLIEFPDGVRYRVYAHGVDQVEFLLSPNAGEGLKPLRRIASGGELSRIMLALKVIMRKLDQVPTLIFDEIDTGISGKTGRRVGEKMLALGKGYQVLCITHLPQIAAQATKHFAVRKSKERRRTLTRVNLLDNQARCGEIARLLGGDPESDVALEHARELLSYGRK